MTSSVPTSVAWEFYDNLIDRRRVLSLSAALAVMIAVLMILAAVVQWIWGVAAERRPLEAVARPLAFVD